MLNILIIFFDVCEHVMHIVLLVPPVRRESSDNLCFKMTEYVKINISAMASRMANPTNQNLNENKTHYTQPNVFCRATNQPC